MSQFVVFRYASGAPKFLTLTGPFEYPSWGGLPCSAISSKAKAAQWAEALSSRAQPALVLELPDGHFTPAQVVEKAVALAEERAPDTRRDLPRIDAGWGGIGVPWSGDM